ncbi:GDSL-type esterase/lipase family protein [Bengtsoniella intestinalis]|uniref:GDSL-type esterase/lipase family protein n=1 Tax=Bengtsoniella intestinalis TaxID=3073143 RepID=UPI00391F78CD
MKKHIICLGDSNTHGYCPDPDDCGNPHLRFDESTRWPMGLQAGLGTDYLVVEEGRSGRTTVFPDPLTQGLAAIDYLHPCLKSHEPVDLLIVMLGTNDTKERFGANAFTIGKGMERLLREAQHTDCWGGKAPNILLIAPPAIREEILTCPTIGSMGQRCVEKSLQVPAVFQEVATLLGCHFLDAGALGCQFNAVDFMHLTAEAHGILADKLIGLVPSLV